MYDCIVVTYIKIGTHFIQKSKKSQRVHILFLTTVQYVNQHLTVMFSIVYSLRIRFKKADITSLLNVGVKVHQVFW